MIQINTEKYNGIKLFAIAGLGKIGAALGFPSIIWHMSGSANAIVALQRNSDRWAALEAKEQFQVELKSKCETSAYFAKVYHTAYDLLEDVISTKWNKRVLAILLTNDDREIEIILSYTIAAVTALGENGLIEYGSKLLLHKYNQDINIYTFENCEDKVLEFTNLAKQNPKVHIVSCLIDKIVTSITVEKDRISVLSEDYECVVFEDNEYSPFASYDERFINAKTPKIMQFYKKRKYYLLNYIHTNAAFIAYSEMIKNNISLEDSKKVLINPLITANIRSVLDRLAQLYIIKILAQTDKDTLREALNIKDNADFLKEAFIELSSFYKNAIKRIVEIDDYVGRILNIDNPENVRKRYVDRIESIEDFFNEFEKPEIREYLDIALKYGFSEFSVESVKDSIIYLERSISKVLLNKNYSYLSLNVNSVTKDAYIKKLIKDIFSEDNPAEKLVKDYGIDINDAYAYIAKSFKYVIGKVDLEKVEVSSELP